MLKKAGTFLLLSLIILLGISPLVSFLREKPTIAVAIRSFSMEPALTRGDLVFIWPTGKNYNYRPGQVIVFRSEEQGINNWTMHRIVGGDAKSGFITAGDAAEQSDQERHFPPIDPEWVAAVTIFIGNYPLKIPYLGNLMLYFSENLKNPFLFTIFLSILALLIAWTPNHKNRPYV